MVAHRDVSPILQRIRAFLLGREHTSTLRFEDALADRTQPPPSLPGGPAHLLSVNYYYKRDPRRTVTPPTNLLQQKLLAADKGVKIPPKLPTPGQVHMWD